MAMQGQLPIQPVVHQQNSFANNQQIQSAMNQQQQQQLSPAQQRQAYMRYNMFIQVSLYLLQRLTCLYHLSAH